MGDKIDLKAAAKAFSQLGASKGGKARAQSLTPEQRQEEARKAGVARWAKARARAQEVVKSNARTTWSNDLRTRKETLEAFAGTTGAEVRHGNFAWGSGYYLILHFDLMTVFPSGHNDRSATYHAVEQAVIRNDGTKLGGSVYIVPLLSEKSSRQSATEFWNTLCDDLRGKLVAGDSFFLHYTPNAKNRVGGIAEVVSLKRGLTKVVVPTV